MKPEPVDSNRNSGHCTTNHNESGRAAPAEALTKVEIGRVVCPSRSLKSTARRDCAADGSLLVTMTSTRRGPEEEDTDCGRAGKVVMASMSATARKQLLARRNVPAAWR